MTWLRLVRAEIRKLTTTKMPWAFLAVLGAFGGINATAVLVGEDADGSKGFIATAADQRSLMAFGRNALMLAALFGAIAAAREYGHGTVVPTFLAAPRRHRAVLAQLTAASLAGALLGLVGAALTVGAIALSLPAVDHEFLLGAGAVARVLGASAVAGSVGAVLGAGIGAVVRNTGGAVTTTFLLLVIAPPLVVQLASGAASWIPTAVVDVVSGVGGEPGLAAAVGTLAAWALVPAAIALAAVRRRDVV